MTARRFQFQPWSVNRAAARTRRRIAAVRAVVQTKLSAIAADWGDENEEAVFYVEGSLNRIVDDLDDLLNDVNETIANPREIERSAADGAPLYYAEGGVVWKRPIRTKTDHGHSITIGFPVCEMHDAAGAAAAVSVAALMNRGGILPDLLELAREFELTLHEERHRFVENEATLDSRTGEKLAGIDDAIARCRSVLGKVDGASADGARKTSP